jgi:hypothetical protein
MAAQKVLQRGDASFNIDVDVLFDNIVGPDKLLA